MTLNRSDILKHIASSMDPDELIDRLGLSCEDLVEKLSSNIMGNLSAFDDIYDPLEGEEDKD